MQNFCHGIGGLLLISAKVAGIKLKLDLLTITHDYPGTLKYSQELYDQCKFVINSCAVQLAATPNRDIAKNAKAFAVEWVLIGKAFDLGFKLCSRIKPLLNSIIESLMADPSVEHVVATAEGVTMHFREKATQVGSAVKKAAKTCHPTLDLFQKQFMDKLAPEIAKVRGMFDRKIKGFGALKGKYFKFDFEHFFGIEFKYNQRGVSNINGFHFDYLQKVEKSKIIEFANKAVLENGVYQADLLYNGKKIKEAATFFPSNWTFEQTMHKVKEVCDYCIKNGIEPALQSNGTYRIQGVTKEGVTIRIFSTKKGYVTTMYPIFEKGIKWNL